MYLRNGRPGGYQFVGRTVQVWNRFRVTQNFETGKPWLLRFFDQIRFYSVSANLAPSPGGLPGGEFTLEIEEERFRLRDYHAFLSGIASEAASFKAKQQAGFEAGRERWASTEFVPVEEATPAAPPEDVQLPRMDLSSTHRWRAVFGNYWPEPETRLKSTNQWRSSSQ